MARRITPTERQLIADRGLIFMGADHLGFMDDADKGDYRLAADAQPQLITAPNSGVPWWTTNFIDPELIHVIFAPIRATEIFGETKKGDWTTLTTQFGVVENTGEVTSYGDFNNDGNTGANINWVPRTAYTFQTISKWGERETDMMALAKLNYKAELDNSAALIFNKAFNKSYFFGIAGLNNYGALNDPSLLAPITPTTKAAGGVSWNLATAQEIFADILALYAQLLLQMGNNIDMDEKLTLAMSPDRFVQLAKLSPFNVSAETTILKAFPNLTIKTAPEYNTTGGQLLQLIIPSFQGQQTAYGAFTEKMRAHAVVPDVSSWKQKKSAGTWGMIIRRPTAIAQMLGI